MIKQKIAVIYGGKSAEHDVSLLTAKSIINEMNKEKYDIYPIFISKNGEWAKGNKILKNIDNEKQLIFNNFNKNLSELLYQENKKFDIVFPVLHGPNGEDGTIQGFLEIMNIAYVGNNVLSSATGMDKAIMKKLFASAELPQLSYIDFLLHDWNKDKEQIIKKLESTLSFPMFVKPANLGSSVGISRCNNKEDLIKGINEALKYDRKIVVEEGVIDAKEIEVAILGYNEVNTTLPGEILNISSSDFYDYSTKYTDGQSRMEIPAKIDETLFPEFRKMATKAFKVLDCSGLARADFFLTKENKIFINEVNTMPGFTKFSMFPSLWNYMGLSYSELIEKLLELALERHNERKEFKND